MLNQFRPQLVAGPKQAASILVGEHTVICLPDKVAFIPSSGVLLVSDLHWGKDAVSRKLGCPIPTSNLVEDLKVLESTIRRFEVKKVIVLGDLIDHRLGLTKETLEAVEQFRDRCPVSMDLLLGNHDRQPEAIPSAWGVEVFSKPVVFEDTFLLSHEPLPENEDLFSIYGHIHPKVFLRQNGARRTSGLQAQAFMISSNSMCLPAFSSLAGGFMMGVGKELGAVAIAGTHMVAMFTDDLCQRLNYKPINLEAFLCP